MERIRSALFLDFDNIFRGLMELDRKAALALVEDPTGWLARLAGLALPQGTRRDFLVRRAYLNPSAWIVDPVLGNENGRVYLQRFRPHLTQAGFEVIDCPALTMRQKNAADIRIVIDILASLDAPFCYDEFIVASSDADFTPLLQRLRAHDRRTMIIAAGTAASAYQCVADRFLDEAALVDLLIGSDEVPEKVITPHAAEVSIEQEMEIRAQVEREVADYVSARNEPSLLSDLGTHLRARFDEAIASSRWFGKGGLSEFVRSIEGGPNFEVRGYFIWDADVHDEPEWAQAATMHVELPASIAQICRITNLPRLTSECWGATFDVLARYARTHEFNLTECTAWTRDQLADLGKPVGRQSIGFVVRGALFGGVRLDSDSPPTARDIREALISATTDRAEALSLALTPADEEELRSWLLGEESSRETVS